MAKKKGRSAGKRSKLNFNASYCKHTFKQIAAIARSPSTTQKDEMMTMMSELDKFADGVTAAGCVVDVEKMLDVVVEKMLDVV
ncbi:MAG: hypothetical protein FJ333_10050, partial [Sphingomonadales bacterium]|nr:hypothetical protein [Sphingomonadales bacterium]